MNTYLLTWNPNKWHWSGIANQIKELGRLSVIKGRWSCGNNKSIKIGDRLFLMRLGLAPKGICASGYAASDVYEDKHWDGTKGKKANYVDLDFDIMLNPEKDKNDILDLETLKHILPNTKQHWTPEQSGITINPIVAEALEKMWFDFLNDTKGIRRNFFDPPNSKNDKQEYFEGTLYQTTSNKYERNPFARKKCIEHFGIVCSVCSFDFEKNFGGIGKGFIHIHHLTPISEIKKEYNLNPLNDLRPVCPNCHAMLHRQKPALTIKELKEKLKTKTNRTL